MNQNFNYQELQRQVLQKQQELESLQNLLHNGPVQAPQTNPLNLLPPQGDYYVEPAIAQQQQHQQQQPQFHNGMPAVRRSTMPRSKSNMGYSSHAATRMMVKHHHRSMLYFSCRPY